MLLYVCVSVCLQAVLYVPSTEEFTVWWEGYSDGESGLLKHDITLMLGSDCDNFDPRQMTTVVESETLSPTSSNFTYLELNLQVPATSRLLINISSEKL